MQTITETDLAYAAEFKVIKSIRIKETSRNSFQVFVLTKDDPSEKPLVTLRDGVNPREWASLERLVKHISKRYGFYNLTLTLYQNENERG